MKAEVVVPESVTLLDDATHISGKRIPQSIISDNGSYSPSQKIVIRPPRTVEGLTDFRGHAITFTASCSATASTYLRFTQSIASLFAEVNVYVGSTRLENIQNYNILHNAFATRNESDWFTAGGGNLFAGYGTVAQRTSWASGRKYSIRLLCGFLNDVIPTSMLSQDIRIEIILANAVDVIVTDGTSPTFTLSNVYLHYYDLLPEAGYMEALRSKIMGGPGLLKGYMSHETYVRAGLTSTSVSEDLSFKYNNFKGLYAVVLDTSKLTSTVGAVSPTSGTGDTKTVDYPFQSQATFQLQVNSTQYPSTPVISTDGIEPYRHFKSIMYKTKSDAASYAAYNYATPAAFYTLSSAGVSTEFFPPSSSYVHGILVEPFPHTIEEDRGMFGGLVTSSGGSRVVWKATYNAAINAGMASTAQINFYSIFEYSLLYKDGMVVYSM